MKISTDKIIAFQKEILAWYALHQRDLPWRRVPFDTLLQSRDPYRILVSEVMCQQTQVRRVIPKYEAWMQKFPTVGSLAEAKTSDVLQYWSGLGYNRRALNLKKAAEVIVSNYNSMFPREEEALLGLPGIGKYTARAVMCFAFDEQVAVVDTNVKKVILTQFKNELEGTNNDSLVLHDSMQKVSQVLTDKELWNIAEGLVPSGKAYEWNQALMDYAGAMLKQEKIAIPKQSKFVGSRRYYRGKILKVLLEKQEMEMKELGVAIKENYTADDQVWLDGLIGQMVREGFLSVTGQCVSLPSAAE